MRIAFWCSMIHFPKNSQINNELKTARLLWCAIFSPAKQQHILDLQLQSFLWIPTHHAIDESFWTIWFVQNHSIYKLNSSKKQKNSAFLMWLPLIGLLRLEKTWIQTLRSAFCNRHWLILVMLDLSRQISCNRESRIPALLSKPLVWFIRLLFVHDDVLLKMLFWQLNSEHVRLSNQCQSTPNR